MRNICLIVFSFVFLQGYSQTKTSPTGNFSNSPQFLEDITGKPIYLKVEYNIEGSPFFPNEYFHADIYLAKGKIYNKVYVKFNLQENLVLFRLQDGTELSATVPIKRIVFTDTSELGTYYNMRFENGFPAIDHQNENTFYEVLDSGKTKLLKYHSVKYNDHKYYGQASITRIFQQSETYYVYFPNTGIKKLEKGVPNFVALFPDKKQELENYINQEKLKCRKEEDWIKAMGYYNSLTSN